MDEQSNLPPVTFSSIPVVSSSIQTSSNLVISTASSGLLSAAASSLASPAVRTIGLLSPPAASNPITLPPAVPAPTTSPFTLRRSVVNPSAGQNVQSPPARYPSSTPISQIQPGTVPAVGPRTSAASLAGTPSCFSALFHPRPSYQGKLAPVEFPPRSSANLAVYVFARVSSIFGWPGHSSSIGQTCFRRGIGPIRRVTGSR